MAKKKSKKTGGKKPKMVTLYAKGLPPKEFNPDHAARLLNRKNTLWSETPFEQANPIMEADNSDNGTPNNPTTQRAKEEEE